MLWIDEELRVGLCFIGKRIFDNDEIEFPSINRFQKGFIGIKLRKLVYWKRKKRRINKYIIVTRDAVLVRKKISSLGIYLSAS